MVATSAGASNIAPELEPASTSAGGRAEQVADAEGNSCRHHGSHELPYRGPGDPASGKCPYDCTQGRGSDGSDADRDDDGFATTEEQHGMRGRKAPIANDKKDAMLACHADPVDWGSIPSSRRA